MKIVKLAILSLVVSLPLILELQAARGSLGGGRSVGNGARGPSMSRAGSANARPAQVNLNGRTITRAQAQQAIGNIPSSSVNNTPRTAQGFSSSSAAGRLSPQQTQAASRIRQLANQSQINGNGRFNNNFWRNAYSPYNGWGYSSWGSVAGYLGYDDNPLYYSDGVAYPADTASEPSPQPVQVVQAPPSSSNTSNSEWMPLGVFTLADINGVASTNMYMQLAINKSGVIQGVSTMRMWIRPFRSWAIPNRKLKKQSGK